MKQSLLPLLAFLAFFAACCSLAEAGNLTITANFTTPDFTGDFAGSTTIASVANASTVESTIDQAIAQITSQVTTNAPENITINFLNIPDGLGASTTNYIDRLSYTTYLADLLANPNKSANDVTALASLAANPVLNPATTTIQLGPANLLAIGETADANSLLSLNGGFAGTVGLNMSLLDDSRTNPNPSSYDLVSTAAHEIDEILGIGGAGSTLGQGQSQPAATNLGALDLFRYSGVATRTHTINPTGAAYFSINNGVTNLVNFNQKAGGDFADWGDGVLPPDGQNNTPLQVQDAFAPPVGNGTPPNIGVNELTALDVVGYNLISVPEPSCVYFLLGGLFAIGIHRRLRKSA